MDSCHTPSPFARRPFVITPYIVSGQDQFVAVLPLECLRRKQAGDSGSEGAVGACVIRLHHRRTRKTGPGFPLYVVECRTHKVSFTVYPPGHVPYGRVAVAPIDAAGQPLHASGEPEAEVEPPDSVVPSIDEEPELAPRPLAWCVTLFRAAQDGAQGVSWPRRNSDGSEVWRTQGRRIALAAALLGLTGATGSEVPDAGMLGIPTLTRRQSRAAYACASGYRERSRAILRSLRELERAGVCTLDLLLAVGHIEGAWGSASRWEPRTGRLRDLVPPARPP